MNSQKQKVQGFLSFASPSFSQMTAQSDIERETINANQKPFLKLVVFSNNLHREFSFNYMKCLKTCIWKSIASQGRWEELLHAIKH